MNTFRKVSSLGLLAALIAVPSLVACSSEGGSGRGVVTPQVNVINQSKAALSAGSPSKIVGTYTGCMDPANGGSRTDGTAWLIDLADSTQTTLAVVQNDSSCALAISEIDLDTTAYDASAAIDLGTSWGTAASFAPSGGSIVFYANAMISSHGYASGFTLSVKLSDDPNAQADTDAGSASFATVSVSSVSQSTVANPNYTLGLGDVSWKSTSDSKVSSVQGSFQLALASGQQAGETYRIVSALADTAYATVDAAYDANGTVAPSTMNNTTKQIAASEFLSVNDALPANRWLIIAHDSDGVRSYEVFKITFNGGA